MAFYLEITRGEAPRHRPVSGHPGEDQINLLSNVPREQYAKGHGAFCSKA
jgi:hypothetical protein